MFEVIWKAIKSVIEAIKAFFASIKKPEPAEQEE